MIDASLRRVGTTIRNKWTLERLLGTGGMAAVYVGIHRIGRRDALKILHPQAAQSKEICRRFEREAHVANRFRHAGAVEIRDIDVTEDGVPFLVMELLDGESLADREQRLGRILLPDVLRFAEQMLDTLDAAHAQGIIHRDIKPDNLYVIGGDNQGRTPEGRGSERIKVLDFGLARIRQDSSVQGELTRMGLVLGTTPYMPPEQARGDNIDLRADLFAVGATMFRLLSGRHIHDAKNNFELLRKMRANPAPPLAARAREVARDVCLVVDRALAFDRDHRYPNAGLMLEDIRAVTRGEPPPHASRFENGIPWDPTTFPSEHAPVSSAPVSVPIPMSGNAPPGTDSVSISIDWSDASILSDDSISVDWSEEPAGAPGGTAAGSTAAVPVGTVRASPAPEPTKGPRPTRS